LKEKDKIQNWVKMENSAKVKKIDKEKSIYKEDLKNQNKKN